MELYRKYYRVINYFKLKYYNLDQKIRTFKFAEKDIIQKSMENDLR